MFGHAFEAFKLMVQDDGAAIIKRLEEAGPLTVLTPAVSAAAVRQIKYLFTLATATELRSVH